MMASASRVLRGGVTGALRRPIQRTPAPHGGEFRQDLHNFCRGLTDARGLQGGVSLSCAVAGERPPPVMPEALGAVGQGLVRNALDHAFPNGLGGRVAVSFEADAAEWRLVVEHSGAARGPLLDGGLDRVRVEVAALGGRLEAPRVIGGTRWVVFVPRP